MKKAMKVKASKPDGFKKMAPKGFGKKPKAVMPPAPDALAPMDAPMAPAPDVAAAPLAPFKRGGKVDVDMDDGPRAKRRADRR